MFVLDEDWRFTYVNEAAQTIFDMDRRKLEGKEFWSQIPDEMRETYRQPFEAALERGEPAEFENRCPLTGRWYRFQVYPFDDGISVHAENVEDRVRRGDGFELREQALRTAQQVIADSGRSFADTVEDLLRVLRNTLDIRYGVLSEVDRAEGSYRVLSVDAGGEGRLPADGPIPLAETPNCATVAYTGRSFAVTNARPRDRDQRGRTLRRGAYLGAPMRIDDEVRGTLCFFSEEPRSEGFADWQITYAEMFADWIGQRLEERDPRPFG